MGVRLEYILPGVIVGIIGAFTMIDVEEDIKQYKPQGKELEFVKTTFIEVDNNKTLGIAYSDYGYRERNIWTMREIRYHTDKINLLQANEGRYKGDYIYLDGNVSVNQKSGFDYKTENAIYNQASEVLNIISPFEAYMNDTIIKGDRLIYKYREKIAVAKNIDAEVHIKEQPMENNESKGVVE